MREYERGEHVPHTFLIRPRLHGHHAILSVERGGEAVGQEHVGVGAPAVRDSSGCEHSTLMSHVT